MALPILLAVIAIGVGVASGIGTRALIPVLRRGQLVDVPNERSLHEVPVPRGGGIAPIAAIVAVWLGLLVTDRGAAAQLAIVAGTIVLAVLSWFDDRAGISPGGRLAVQILVVALSLLPHPLSGAVFQSWLPPLLDRVATVVLWVWFLNLFNFMDGADGLAGSEATAIGAGIALVAATGAGYDPALALLGAVAAAAALGFLTSNWAPARVFMGDVGSVPLGYLTGFLLLQLAAEGLWKAALILPLYFLADATITLGRRTLRGDKVWRAHRQHFYQRAVLGGLSHAAMVARVITANLALIACAWAAENGYGTAALGAAVAVVAILLLVLARAGYTKPL